MQLDSENPNFLANHKFYFSKIVIQCKVKSIETI